jgi:UDP-N-acetylmuramoyl-L-alanyl-D-glutamate--2,6-diaminopimelate ligase
MAQSVASAMERVNMRLKNLLKSLPSIDVRGSKEIEISSITANSHLVVPGSLFIAKRGSVFDGNQFVPEAIASGAVCVLSDLYDPSLQITQLVATDVRSVEAHLAAAFWQWPSKELMMVGVTGTSGKTTTTYILRHLFSHVGISSGLIGTVAYIAGDRQCEAPNTTPDVVTTHRLLREIARSGSAACVMEVSSHALEQGRVAEVGFDTAIFTNLSHEHLDYHVTMEAYAHAKNRLFRSLGEDGKTDAIAVANAQDPWMKAVLEGTKAKVVTYAIDAPADVQATNLRFTATSTTFMLSYEGSSLEVCLPLAGRYNVANALAAASAFLARGYSLEQMAKGLATVQAPPGRLERVANEAGLTVYVDYAHKVDALRKVLETLREGTPGRLITVFGCGGDRDRAKRPLMAKASEELSDITIVTSDNPRSEDPHAIIQEICGGFAKKGHHVIADRREAIDKAVRLANTNDVVLIAGKGHEKYQIFAHGTVPFDDCQVVSECCASRVNKKGA